MKNDVRFVRIRGRIVPIKGKKKKSTAIGSKQKKTNRKVAIAGVGGFIAGGLASIVSSEMHLKARSNAKRARKFAIAAVDLPKFHPFRKSMAQHAVDTAEKSMKFSKNAKVFRKLSIAGLGLYGAAITHNLYNRKKR